MNLLDRPKAVQYTEHRSMSFFQESATYNLDLAIVPDLNLKRKRTVSDLEDLFGSDLQDDHEFNSYFVSPKRYCGELFPPVDSCKPAYNLRCVQPAPKLQLERNLIFGSAIEQGSRVSRVRMSMHKDTLPSMSFVDDHLQNVTGGDGAGVHRLVITEEPEQVPDYICDVNVLILIFLNIMGRMHRPFTMSGMGGINNLTMSGLGHNLSAEKTPCSSYLCCVCDILVSNLR